jgi:uncharacterized protein YndB with AHSA1/START domain
MAEGRLTMPKPAAIAVQTFKAPPERVYDAVLDPGMIRRFMFGPLLREEEILHIRNAPEVGGAFSFKVRRGAVEIDHIGEYLELDRPRRIAFTWAVAPDRHGSKVVIDIEPTKEGCRLTLTHELAPGWEKFADQARGSWEKMLGVLSTLVPAQPKVADKPDRISLIYIRAEPQTVWDAVLNESKRYFFGHTMQAADKPGGAFSLVRPDGSVGEEGVVLANRPPNRLRVTWNTVWDRSIPSCEVEWLIEAQATEDGSALTKLTVFEFHQNGLPPQFEEPGRNGWAIILSGIKSIIETGEPLPAIKSP